MFSVIWEISNSGLPGLKVYSVGRRNKNTGSNKSFTSEFTLHGPGYALFLLNSIRSLFFFQGLFSPPPPPPLTDSTPFFLFFFFPRFRLPPCFRLYSRNEENSRVRYFTYALRTSALRCLGTCAPSFRFSLVRYLLFLFLFLRLFLAFQLFIICDSSYGSSLFVGHGEWWTSKVVDRSAIGGRDKRAFCKYGRFNKNWWLVRQAGDEFDRVFVSFAWLPLEHSSAARIQRVFAISREENGISLYLLYLSFL